MKNGIAKNIEIASYDSLFQTGADREDELFEKITELPLSELHDFSNHPYKVLDDEAMQESESRPNQNQNGAIVNVIVSKTYDSMGNISTEKDSGGRTTSYDYDEQGLLIRTNYPDGGVEAREYDLAGRLTAIVSPQNYVSGTAFTSLNRTTYAYDKMDRQTSTKEIYKKPGATAFTTVNAETMTYDKNGNMLTKKDGMGYTTTLTYDAANRVKSTKDAMLKTTSFAYDALGRTTKETNAKNIPTTYTYDHAGNILTKSIDGIKVLTNTYDLTGNIFTATDANGGKSTSTYNLMGKPRTFASPSGTGVSSYTVNYRYDIMGNLIREYDVYLYEKRYTYDNMGKALTVSDGVSTMKTAYDAAGNPVYLTDANGNKTTNTYDNMNRLLSSSITVKDANSVSWTQTTTFTYDKNGNKKSETNWRGNAYQFNYDALNRLVEKIDPNGISIEKLEYNNNNLQTKTTDALGHSNIFAYDKNGRLLSTTDAMGYRVSQAYDAVGNVISKTDGNNKTTTFEYDDFNRQTVTRDPSGRLISEFQYDYNGNAIKQIDGKGNVVETVYNARNLPVERVDQTGMSEMYTYNQIGMLLSKTDRNGIVTKYTYSPQGRLLSENAGGEIVSYTYDKSGNQLTMTDATGTTTRAYDSLNRVFAKTVPGFGTTTFLYDVTNGVPAGFVGETAIGPDGKSTTKVFDKLGRLSEVRDSETGTTIHTYFANGNLQKVTYKTGLTETYTYYDNNKLKTLTNTLSPAILDAYSYGYDAAGNMTSKVDGLGTTTYTYTDLNQLLTVTEPGGKTTTYTYDLSGNRATETITETGKPTVTTTSTYNLQNRLMQTDKVEGVRTETTKFSYDAAGNMLSRIPEVVEPADGAPETLGIAMAFEGMDMSIYTYDNRNQMTTAWENGETVESKYNGDGLRVEKKTAEKTTQYAYEYDKIVMEKEGTNTMRNVYGLNLIGRTLNGSDTAFYLYNGHHDVTKLVSDSGQVLASYYHDSFGNVTEKTGETDNPYTYSGYFYDQEVNLYYLNSRFYDARTSRMLSEDSYRGDPTDALSLNLYTYCSNNPLIYYDPSGHDKVIVVTDKNGVMSNRGRIDSNGNITVPSGTVSVQLGDRKNTSLGSYTGGTVTRTSSGGSRSSGKSGSVRSLEEMTFPGSKSSNYLTYVSMPNGTTQIGIVQANGGVKLANKYGEYVIDAPAGATVQYSKDSNDIKGVAFPGLIAGLGGNGYFGEIDRMHSPETLAAMEAYRASLSGNDAYPQGSYYQPASYVSLSAWLEDRKDGLSYLASNIIWREKTGSATVTVSNTDAYAAWIFINGVDGTYIGNDNRMYVDEYRLWEVFGTIIDPPLEYNPVQDAVVAGVVIGTGYKLGEKLVRMLAPAAPLANQETTDFYVSAAGKAVPQNLSYWIGTNQRDVLMNAASDPNLKTAIGRIFKMASIVGNGGTGDVLRFENATGILLSPAGHAQKAMDAVSNLYKMVESNILSSSDTQLAISIMNDLLEAIEGR